MSESLLKTDPKLAEAIFEKAFYSAQKPRKKHKDHVFLVASTIMGGEIKGEEWMDEVLKKFGWNEKITEEEKVMILNEAKRLIEEEKKC